MEQDFTPPSNPQRYKPPGIPIEAGLPGYNEHGVLLSACRGIIQDEHYWARVAHLNRQYRATATATATITVLP